MSTFLHLREKSSTAMASGIYAIAHIGRFKLYVGEVSKISKIWPVILAQLDSGTYPHAELQEAWNAQSNKRHFSFHTQKELIGHWEILGIEKLAKDVDKK